VPQGSQPRPQVALDERFGDARRSLLALLDQVGWTGDEDLVLLAVQEALTNAVRHGRGLRRASAQVADGELVVEVADYGESFEAGPYVRNEPDLLVERGRGLWMMGQLASALEVHHETEGNAVELRFQATPPEPEPVPSRPSALSPLARTAHPLLEAIPAGILLVDDDLVVQEANTTLLRMLGRDGDDVVGEDLRAFVATTKHAFREPEEFVDRVLYLCAHPETQADEILQRRDGSLLRRRSFPVLGDDGTVLGRIDAYSRLGEEAMAIAAMQRALLPRLPSWTSLDVGAVYHAATASSFVGGDFYDFVDLPGGGRCVVIGDVSGRGATAAATSASVRAYLRAALEVGGVTAAFTDLDRAVSRELAEDEFVTLAVATEEARGVWTAMSCGHEPPLVLSGGEVRVLDVAGDLLGMEMADIRARQAFTLAPGDVLVLYTDGVIDAGYGRHRFGLDRLVDAVAAGAGLGAQQLVDSIDRRVHEFAAGALSDDHAIVAVVVR
jgi:anti-sigma regulatory factor (Ser/Thr protein kinase)